MALSSLFLRSSFLLFSLLTLGHAWTTPHPTAFRKGGLTTGFASSGYGAPFSSAAARPTRLFATSMGDKLFGDLKVIENVAGGSKFASLTEYLKEWAELFESGVLKLTTPVEINVVNPDNLEAPKAKQVSAVQIVFLKVDTGYKSKKEEDAEEEDEDKSEEKDVLQGGVEIVVEQIDDSLKVIARRCNMEDDTVIKEMSEETILTELDKALDVWKKQQS